MKKQTTKEPDKPVALPSLAEAIDTAIETLDMDSHSIVFDEELRATLSAALAVLESHRDTLRVADQLLACCHEAMTMTPFNESAVRERIAALIKEVGEKPTEEAA